MILLNLFLAFVRVGLFAIGGAYSFLPVIEKEVVEKYGWLSKKEFLDVLGFVNIFPGAISIKYATYTGYKVAGLLGAIAANAGNLFAPVAFILFASAVYIKYRDLPAVKGAFTMVQFAVLAMIMAVAFRLADITQLVQLKNLVVIIVSFVLFTYTNIHPALVIIGAGIVGAFVR